MRRWLAAILVAFAASTSGFAQGNVVTITLDPGKNDYANAPLTIPLSVPKAWAAFTEVEVAMNVGRDVDMSTVGQLTAPSLVTESIKPAKEGLVRRDLHVVLPQNRAGLVVHFKEIKPQVTRFAWTEKKGEYQELILTRSGTFTPYLRYMNRPYDPETKDARDKTYKVFHHLYDTAGKRFVTNGGHTDNFADPKKLLFPHHRGIMYGFNKCSYGPDLKKKADTWHCTGDAHVGHEKTLATETGPVLGRHRVLLGWYGEKNERFAEEERELSVYHIKGGALVEFASRLKTTDGKIKVDGDPQHAGFQFRAHNDVAAITKKQTYYLHPIGTKGELGKERNWPGDKAMVDLPWYGMSFVLGEQRYSVCYLNHPSNPKETRFSERDYGRFGGYFEREITEDRPLVVNYRLWLQNGEITTEQAQALRTAFAAPLKWITK
ncbi:MAG: hypothetical protein EXR98_17400 [Gemmataceae bacterium]|nr:hypothetical protein [Gemmataceae bacterium]